jgi:hypothetical protein
MQNVKGTIDHLKNHQKYPANKADLIASCNQLSDFSKEDKLEFTRRLPERTYKSAEEVIKALGL